jgi:mRNA interferase RelE/StbE
MRLVLSKRALVDYKELTAVLKKTADKQFSFLLINFNHPSLRVKKYNEVKNIWQARLNRDWRFYFQVRGDIYFVITIIRHPK